MKKILFAIFAIMFAVPAMADYGVVDALNLAPFVPMVLDAFMSVAQSTYEFFVGKGDGIIYVLVWTWLAISVALYLVKLYFPKNFASLFGFNVEKNIYDGKVSGLDIGYNLLKPALRAVIAATLLLQIRPVLVTNVLINPFLQFGAIYTESISESITQNSPFTGVSEKMSCPGNIVQQGYLSQKSCEFLVQPISDITHVNNQMIKRGLDFLSRGIMGLMTIVPHGGNFLNIVTGIILIMTFVSSNFFMALLIIQGIFDFGIALILYPFKVLMYVAKPANKDAWVDPWPAFSDIIESLKKLVITMIACVFILAVNIAIVRALFNWNSSVFVVAAGGSTSTNAPIDITQSMGFGQHSVVWLSSILTFFLMFKIFDSTRKKLMEYAPGMDGLYKKVSSDAKIGLNTAKTATTRGGQLFRKYVLNK